MRPHPLRPQGFFLIAALVLAAVWAYSPNRARPLVIDGDTLMVNDAHIRLHGIDAPEREQVCFGSDASPYFCGRMAAARLRQEIEGARLDCHALYRDIYRRQVATCTAGDRDLSDAMVRAGWALDVPFYSGGKYLDAENEARAARRGLWAGGFEAPRHWRRKHPQRIGP